MTRSVWKGPYIASCFSRSKFKSMSSQYKRGSVVNSSPKPNPMQIYSRGSVILPLLVGNLIAVHNGNKCIIMVIKEEMVGHKFGEFSFPKKKPIHKKKQKTK